MELSTVLSIVFVVAFLAFIVYRWKKGGSSNPISNFPWMPKKRLPGDEDRNA